MARMGKTPKKKGCVKCGKQACKCTPNSTYGDDGGLGAADYELYYGRTDNQMPPPGKKFKPKYNPN